MAYVKTIWTNGATALSAENMNHIEEGIAALDAGKADKVSGKGLSTNDYTNAEKTKLAGIATGAEVNQNAFSNVKVGSTTVAADGKTDTLELVAGSNVTLTPDATNDKVTISATNTTYSDATTSAHGLMSAADKTKLNGVATGAEVNQNAFSNVKVGSTTVAADAKTDTLELVAGTNVTLTPDATNDKVTIASTNTWRGVQNNLTSTSTTDSLSAYQGKVLNDGKAAKSEAIKNITRSGTTFTATKADGTTFTFTQQDNNTTYSDATTSTHGLMSAADKSKLDGLTFANIASKFMVKYLLAENISISAGQVKSDISITANQSGYTTVGVVGFAIQPASDNSANYDLVSVVRVRLGEINSNSVAATLKNRSSSSNAKVNFGVYVLYFKNS